MARSAPLGARPGPLPPPRDSSDLVSKSYVCLLVQEKSWQSFIPFDIPFLRNSKIRKKQKLTLGSGLWVNKLVPKLI